MTLYAKPRPDELDPGNLPWRVIPEVAGGGRFVDLGSHMFDFLDYVLGPIREVQGFAANQQNYYPAEDMATATFVFASGIQGVGVWNFGSFEEVDITEIVGSQGKISYSTYDAEPVVLTTGDDVIEFDIEYPPHIQQPLIQTVVDDLNGTGTCPSTGESAARTTWVIDQILRGYRTRQGLG